jgi:hypothetical protein
MEILATSALGDLFELMAVVGVALLACVVAVVAVAGVREHRDWVARRAEGARR